MYNKLFGKILDSSIWLAPDPHRLVWITLLAAMDEDGNAMFASAGNLAVRARVPREDAEAAVTAFESPDPDSGDPDNEGRRIERFPGGWHVLNAEKYRKLVTRAIIKEQTRARVQKHRAEKRKANAQVTQEKRKANGSVTPSDTDRYTDSNERKEIGSPAQAPATPPPPFVLHMKDREKPALKPFLGDENENDFQPRALVLLADKFELPSAWGRDAEALGWSVAEILREAEKFRQYWVSGKGAGKRRSIRGWRTSWTNWLGKAERYKP